MKPLVISPAPHTVSAVPCAAIQRRAADLWWLNPVYIVTLGVLPVYLSILAFDFKKVVPNTYVPSGLYWFGMAMILAVALGAQWALSNSHHGPAQVPPRLSLGVMMALLLPALAAYAIWFGPLLSQPHLLVEIINGERSEVRNDIHTIKGVTTFTQFGVAYVIAYAIKRGARQQKVHRIEHLGLVLLFSLAVFRAFAWAERLAVIELLVCFSVTRLAYLPVINRRRWRIAAAVPAVAPVVLYVLFTASEYFRSWEFYAKDYDSVWAFTLERLINYYATAVNNGIGVLEDTHAWPYFTGAFTFESLYLIPGMGQLFADVWGNVRGVEAVWLNIYGRPEFNSPTAFFRTLLDVGYFGSIVHYMVLGYIIGRAYAGFRRGHTFGLLMYGVFVLYLIESLRYGYLAETRFVPLAVGLMILALDIQRQRRLQPPIAT